MVGVFHVLVFITALFAPSCATPLPRSVDGVKDLLARTIAREESLVAQSLLQTSATLHRWGAQHSAQLEVPSIATAESFVRVTTAQEVTAMKSLLHATAGIGRVVDHRQHNVLDAKARAASSFRRVSSHLRGGNFEVVAAQAAIEVAAVQAQPEKWASAPSLLQTSEGEGGGSLPDIALSTQHALVRGLSLRLSQLQSESSASVVPFNMVALLGVIVGLAALMLQLTSSGQPSVVGQLGGRKSRGLEMQGSMQKCGACTTDRGS